MSVMPQITLLYNGAFRYEGDLIKVVTFGNGPQFDLFYDYDTSFFNFFQQAQKTHSVDGVWIYLPEFNEVPNDIEKIQAPLIASVSDWNLGYFQTKHILGKFDIILADKRGTEIFKSWGLNAHYFTFYVHKMEMFTSREPQKPIWDIVFIGNMNPYVQKGRAALARRILKMSDRYKVKVATNCYGEEYINLHLQAKIVFNGSIRGEANIRTYEALGSDSLIVMEETNGEIQDYFEPGVECVLYNDQNLEQVLSHYLDHDEERNEIIRNAARKKPYFKKAQHSNRLYDLLLKCHFGSIEYNKRPFLGLSQQDQEYANLLQFCLAPHASKTQRTRVNLIEKFSLGSTNSRDIGLVFTYIVNAVALDKPLPPQQMEIYKKIFNIIGNQPRGQIYNLLNYAYILSSDNSPEEEIVLKKILTVIDSSNDLELFEGAPGFNASAPYFMNLNLYSYETQVASEVSIQNYIQNIVLTRLANISLANQDCQSSYRYAMKAVNHYNQNPESYYLLGAMQKVNQHPGAFESFLKAYLLVPVNYHYWKSLLQEAVNTGREVEAIALKGEMELLEPIAKALYQVDEFNYQEVIHPR